MRLEEIAFEDRFSTDLLSDTGYLLNPASTFNLLRGFLQHALRKGFSKVRYYGWMASNSRTTHDRVNWRVWLYLGWTFRLGSGVGPQPERFVSRRSPCEYCGGALHLIAITDGTGRILMSRALPSPALADHATNYLDSG